MINKWMFLDHEVIIICCCGGALQQAGCCPQAGCPQAACPYPGCPYIGCPYPGAPQGPGCAVFPGMMMVVPSWWLLLAICICICSCICCDCLFLQQQQAMMMRMITPKMAPATAPPIVPPLFLFSEPQQQQTQPDDVLGQVPAKLQQLQKQLEMVQLGWQPMIINIICILSDISQTYYKAQSNTKHPQLPHFICIALNNEVVIIEKSESRWVWIVWLMINWLSHHWLSVICRISTWVCKIARLTDWLTIGGGVLLIWLSVYLWVLSKSLEHDSGCLILVWIVHILSSNFFLQPFLLSLSVAVASNKNHEYCSEDASDDNTGDPAGIGCLAVVVVAAVGTVRTESPEIAAIVEAILVVTV